MYVGKTLEAFTSALTIFTRFVFIFLLFVFRLLLFVLDHCPRRSVSHEGVQRSFIKVLPVAIFTLIK